MNEWLEREHRNRLLLIEEAEWLLAEAYGFGDRDKAWKIRSWLKQI